jgi:phosphosulfolactate phosphohydrolase-like enzyme
VTPEQAAVIAAARDLERKVQAVVEAERRLTEALADLAAAEGNHLRVEPVGPVWRSSRWHP